MMAISPDEGGTNRAVYLANVLGLDMGMFYKRRDYTKIVDGRNPIVAHEFLGSSVEGKDVIIIDDMISSGDSIIDVATELKQRKANRIFAAATFGLFTNGMEKFDKAYEDGIIHGILTTNLIYQTPELLSKPYYINCDMSKYIALIIDTLNHDGSLSSIFKSERKNPACSSEIQKRRAGLRPLSMLFSYFKRINYYEQTKQQNRTKKKTISDTLFTAFMLFTATAVSFCLSFT